MEQYLPKDHRDRIQRALNESKRNELRERYGMAFNRVSEDVPPDMEAEFLLRVEEFERRWEERRAITVREYLGDPDVRPFDEIPPDQISVELERVTAILAGNNIHLHFICPVPDDVAYRFITGEFFDHEIDDIRIEGMVHGFIYEEFHPNHFYDISTTALDVAEGLIEGCGWKIDLYCNRELRIGDLENLTIADARLRLVSPMLAGAVVTSIRGAVGPCQVDGAHGRTEVEIGWKGMMTGSGEAREGRYRWRVDLELRHGEFWVVTAITPIA